MMSNSKIRAEVLIKAILEEPGSSRTDVLVNELLTEFHRGYALDHLRLFLVSHDEQIVRIGIWVASELGEKGKPLLGDVLPLLNYPVKAVRFFAVDCILLWAEGWNRRELATVVGLLEDIEPAVRRKAMDFLARASKEQIQGALAYLEATATGSRQVRGLEWLTGENAANPSEVISMLENQDGLLRKYGAVASSRMSKENRELLLYAASIDDDDVKQFALDGLGLLKPRRSRP